jgi:DnaJ-class molecular chaperone
MRPKCATSECSSCEGHGQFNSMIDLHSFRSIRGICDQCDGTGYLVDDKKIIQTIIYTNYPKWVQRISK